ncbi:MAG: Rieske (2Fe-2S) protein [Gemmatimonadaceae bacterium]|nr:Rieske (2Fe-2S) protein [Gemmatimonadaceae bacterium]
MSDHDVDHPCPTECPLVPTVGRRTFVAQGMLAAAALALAACGGDGATSPSVTPVTLKLSDFPTLANVGGVATTRAGNTPIAVVRSGAATFAAFSRVCPHEGETINVGGPGFTCPRHGAQFTLTGRWQGGQRAGNLRSLTTAYDANAATVTVS